MAAALLGLAGCGGSNGDNKTGAGSSSSGAALDQAGQDRLALLTKGTSTEPATSIAKPPTGKTVWIISFGQVVESVGYQVQGAKDAMEALGWKVNVFDGQVQPNEWLSGVQQAVAAGADGIILADIDCAPIKNGLEQAKQAGIPVVGIESNDCDPSLESVVSYAEGDFLSYMKSLGSDSALWLVNQVGSGSKIIELRETDTSITIAISDGYQATLKDKCPDCTNVVVDFTAADLGPGLQEKVQQALLRNPDAKGLMVPYDDVVNLSSSAAVVASGRAKDLKVVSIGGTVGGMDLMKQGRGLTADLLVPTRWEGFASVDWLIRLFDGEQPTPQDAATGIGTILVDAHSDLPAKGLPPVNIDFEAAYYKAWGVSP